MAGGPSPGRRLRAAGAPLVVGTLALAAALAVGRQGGVTGVDLCPFHRVTGLWCPFCGGLRATAALVRGDLPAALSLNVVVPPLLLLLAVVGLRTTARALRTCEPARLPVVPLRPLLVALVLLAVFTVWRNVPELPLAAWLAP
ncbi:DUF2752 domain-containing protein [Lapillicoccus jejuensis]|uniref:DUF2752 domain-containing protein n=1 Tax=Lapillicoccus jejuensis TaxID=402171 RepID=UPI0011507875|nr:DUF2752 domain-containing protein [Lapillicoccus jejuensis]